MRAKSSPNIGKPSDYAVRIATRDSCGAIVIRVDDSRVGENIHVNIDVHDISNVGLANAISTLLDMAIAVADASPNCCPDCDARAAILRRAKAAFEAETADNVGVH